MIPTAAMSGREQKMSEKSKQKKIQIVRTPRQGLCYHRVGYLLNCLYIVLVIINIWVEVHLNNT